MNTYLFWRDDRPYRRTSTRRGFHLESEHPQYGWLPRGWIRQSGVADTTGPGLAGHLVWTLTDPDANLLDPVCGDYVTAETALLEATKQLDD